MSIKAKILAIFTWLVVLGAIFFALLRTDISSVRTQIFNIFNESRKKYAQPTALLKRQVVEEESAVISVVENVSPSVVSVIVKSSDLGIFSDGEMYESGVGTGFIVDPNGLIVTNSHVVDDPTGEYSIVLSNGETYAVDKIHTDAVSDLAILEVTGRDLPVVKFGDSDKIKVGQTAIAIGNALGQYQNSVTVGVVSGIARELVASSGWGEVKSYEGAIQTDAAVNPGNSGGPLLNLSGEVVGVNVATSYGADNISFAIPINDLKPLIEVFLKGGKIIRPYLGVAYAVITPEISALRKLPEGAFVSKIVAGSPAEEAGLKRGDIITFFEGEPLTDKNSLSKAISKKKVGDRVEFKVDRNGKTISLSTTLAESPVN